MAKVVKTDSAPPRAIIYTRVSTQHQSDHGTSLAGQFEACKRKAAEIGAQVVGFHEETKSGGLYLTRGELQKALTEIEAGRANVLILAKLDRTGRDVDSMRDIRTRIHKAGGRLVFADGMQFENTAIGKLMFTQVSAFAEWEKEVIRERMAEGMERLAKSGKQPSRSIPPYGYKIWLKNDAIADRCTQDQVGTYYLIENEAKWVKQIFERMAQGDSLRGVASWLEKAGVKTRKGGAWNPATIKNIIENPAHKGRPAWRKTQSILDESRAEIDAGVYYGIARDESEWVYFDAPAIVSEEVWAKANEMMVEGRAERSGRNDHKRFLTGMIFCPRCGKRIHARASSSRHITTEGTIKRYPSYAYKCEGTTRRNAQGPVTCDLPTLSGPALDELVKSSIIEYLQHPNLAVKARKEFERSRKRDAVSRTTEDEIKALEQEITRLQQREDAAANALIEAKIVGSDGHAFERARTNFEMQRKAAEEQLQFLELKQQSLTAPSVQAPVEDASALVEILLDTKVPDARKGMMLRPFVRFVYPRIAPDELRVSAKARRIGEERKSNNSAIGGCDIVLRNSAPGPVMVLSRELLKLEPCKDSHYRNALRKVWKTKLKMETENPFPHVHGRGSSAENEAWRRAKKLNK